MPGGRPTNYRPEYCAQVVEHCRDGKSLVSFAASIEQSRATIYQWINTHKEFSDACARAMALAQSWFESKCRENMGNREFNARLAEFQMAARFRDDYAPQCARIELNHTGGVQVRSLGREELLRLAGEAILDAEIVENPAQLPQTAEVESSKISQNEGK